MLHKQKRCNTNHSTPPLRCKSTQQTLEICSARLPTDAPSGSSFGFWHVWEDARTHWGKGFGILQAHHGVATTQYRNQLACCIWIPLSNCLREGVLQRTVQYTHPLCRSRSRRENFRSAVDKHASKGNACYELHMFHSFQQKVGEIRASSITPTPETCPICGQIQCECLQVVFCWCLLTLQGIFRIWRLHLGFQVEIKSPFFIATENNCYIFLVTVLPEFYLFIFFRRSLFC